MLLVLVSATRMHLTQSHNITAASTVFATQMNLTQSQNVTAANTVFVTWMNLTQSQNVNGDIYPSCDDVRKTRSLKCDIVLQRTI